MKAMLVMFTSDGTRKNFTVHPDKRYTIGRKESCDLRMPLASVSREHAAIFFDEEEDELVIEDLGSSNGTYVNNQRIDERVELTPGDVVRIGEVPFQVVIDGYPVDLEPIVVESRRAQATGAGNGQGGSGGGGSSDEGESTGGIPDDDPNVDSFFGFDLDDSDI